LECVDLAKGISNALVYKASKAHSPFLATSQSSHAAYSQVHSCIVNVALKTVQHV